MNKKQIHEWCLTFDKLKKFWDAGKTEQILDKLHRAETTLHRIAENKCNGWRTADYKEDEAWRKHDERRAEATEKRVKELVETYGIKVEFNGDPRGGAVRLILPDGASNNWDGKTWGIYW